MKVYLVICLPSSSSSFRRFVQDNRMTLSMLDSLVIPVLLRFRSPAFWQSWSPFPWWEFPGELFPSSQWNARSQPTKVPTFRFNRHPPQHINKSLFESSQFCSFILYSPISLVCNLIFYICYGNLLHMLW